MKSIPLKKLLAALILLLSPLTMLAQEAYAVYTEKISTNSSTLTFYCDNQRSTRQGTTYDLNSGTNSPGWYKDGNYKNVFYVVFDSSFQNARPTSTNSWFDGMNCLISIAGMGKNLNTSEVTNMSEMFRNCSNLGILEQLGYITDLSGFNTEKVTDMSEMFRGCSSLKSLDLSSFNTAKVTDMMYMFSDCSSLTSLDVSDFNTAKVTDMYGMFNNCVALTTIYCDTDWYRSDIRMTGMFYNCTSLKGSNGTVFDKSNTGGTYAHPDAADNPGYFTPPPYAVLSTDGKTLIFYYDTQRSTREGTKYNLNNGPGWRSDDNYKNVTRVYFARSFKDVRPTSTSNWFDGMSALTTITGMKEYLNTSEVTDMRWMFGNCSSLTSIDLSGFNTAKVTSMEAMFFRCSSLTSLDLSNFNTAKVTNMFSMFSGCSSLTTIICDDDWNRSELYSIRMFNGCTNLVGGNGTKYDETNVDAAYAHPDAAGNPGYFTPRPYVVLNGTTLTFYCDTQRSTRTGTKYDLNIGTNSPGWHNSSANVTKVVFDSSFKNVRPTSTGNWFGGMSKLTSITGMKEYLNTSEVTDMRYMFYGCSSLTSIDVSGFNTENVTYMINMFYGCSSLTTIYCNDDWNRLGLVSSSMFSGCTSLKGGNGTEFDDSHIDGTYAHPDAAGNPGYFTLRPYAALSDDGTTLTFYYDTQRSTRGTTYDLNSGAYYPVWRTDGTYAKVTQVVFDSSFRDARPTSTYCWFYDMDKLTSITGMKEYLNTSDVTNMSFMFCNCSSLTSLDVSNFNTSQVTDMHYMFWGCSSLTSLDVGGFNTAKVTDMEGMFGRCSSMTSIDVSSFNTEKVTDMQQMFWYCSSLTTIYCDKDWKNVTNSTSMFTGCTSLVGGNGTVYDASNVTAAYAHPDAAGNPGYFTKLEAYAALDGTTLTFYCDTQRSTRGTTYDLNSGANTPGWYTDNNYKIVTKVVFAASFKDARPTSTYRWFYYMQNLNSITGMKENLNTSKVTNMSAMFYNCFSLTSIDVSGFNTENVTDMSDMFSGCSKPTSIDVSGFNTENVTNMSCMFFYCCQSSRLDVSSFNTEKVTNMSNMFLRCFSLTSLDVSSFNTENVTNMSGMFHSCYRLKSLDLSSFNTENVTRMKDMFFDCSSLTTIICNDDWYRSGITSTDMFSGCESLKGGDGTVFDDTNVDATYAHPDAAGNPGYFTKFLWGDANGDGKVTITDAVAVVNYILNTTQGTFNVAAADVDGNGSITITDAVSIVNIILNSSSAGVKERSVREEIGLEKDPD